MKSIVIVAVLFAFANVIGSVPVSEKDNDRVEHGRDECKPGDDGTPHGTGCDRHVCFGGVRVDTEDSKPECMESYNKTLGYVNDKSVTITCNGDKFCFGGSCYDFYRVLFKIENYKEDVDEAEKIAEYLLRGPYHDPFRRPDWFCLCHNSDQTMLCFRPGKDSSSWKHETHAGCYAPGSRHGFVNLGEKADDGSVCKFIGYLGHSKSPSKLDSDDDDVDSKPVDQIEDSDDLKNSAEPETENPATSERHIEEPVSESVNAVA